MGTKMDDLIENFHCIAGGAELEESEDDVSLEDDVDTDDSDLSSDSDAQDDDSGPIPRERWNVEYAKHQSLKTEMDKYSEFGDIDSIRSKLDNLKGYEEKDRAYEAQLKIAREQNSLSQEQLDKKKSDSSIRQQMEDVYPELKDLGRFKELDSIKKYQEDQNMAKASDHLGSLLKINGADIDSEAQGDIEDFMLSKMSDKERNALISGDTSVIDSAFSKVRNSVMLSHIFKQKEASDSSDDSLKQIAPRRHKAGGQSAKAKSKKPMSADDAMNAAWEMMKNG